MACWQKGRKTTKKGKEGNNVTRDTKTAYSSLIKTFCVETMVKEDTMEFLILLLCERRNKKQKRNASKSPSELEIAFFPSANSNGFHFYFFLAFPSSSKVWQLKMKTMTTMKKLWLREKRQGNEIPTLDDKLFCFKFFCLGRWIKALKDRG